MNDDDGFAQQVTSDLTHTHTHTGVLPIVLVGWCVCAVNATDTVAITDDFFFLLWQAVFYGAAKRTLTTQD